MLPTETRNDRAGVSKGKRIALGALIGAVPGAVLMAVNLTMITGEAALSVGVGALMLMFGGIVAGAALGAQRRLHVAPTIIGALIGSIPGIAAFVMPGGTRLAPFVLIAGAIVGGLIGGRRRTGDR